MTNVQIMLIVSCIGLSLGGSGPAVATDAVSCIQPEREVLTVAKEAHFDYMGNLRRAELGDRDAIIALINFSPRTDAAASLAHGWVLLELRKMIGNNQFAIALARATDVGRKSTLGSMDVAAKYEKGSR